MGNFKDNGLSEERKKKLREDIERMRGTNTSCGSFIPRNVNPFEPAFGTCSIINKEVKIPSSVCGSVSSSYVSSGEKMFDQLAKENKKLTQEKIKLNLKVLQLEKQNYELMENYAKLKSYVEANKGQFWKDLINNIKEVFNNIVNWFNS